MTRVLKSGRVLISGRGGAAKTTLVNRLARDLSAKQFALPIVLNLKSWTPLIDAEWKSLPDDVSFRMEFLLTRVGVPKLNLAMLDGLEPALLRLIIADGLNEITPSVAQQVIVTLDEHVRRAPQSGVIITDRIVRRDFASPRRWNLCTVMPLSDNDIRNYLKSSPDKLAAFDAASTQKRSLLRTPLFLNQFLHSAGTASSNLLNNAAELRYYFVNQIGLSSAELRRAAIAAFGAYEHQAARTFSVTSFTETAGAELTAKLTEAGALHVKDGLGFFTPPSAPRFPSFVVLAENQDHWVPKYFDVVTFYAASFDILALSLEQLETPGKVDTFLERLYDWNVYAPAYALAEARHGGDVHVSPELEVEILAMLSERKWDRITSTAQKAKDGLAIFPTGSRARAFLQTAHIADLFDLVWRLNSDSRKFNDWRRLFTLSPDSKIDDATLTKVREVNSVSGWTLANVLKRISITDAQIALMRSWLNEFAKEETVLWRLAHVLGAYPSRQNAEALFAVCERTDVRWASYGALRSLTEMAARSSEPSLTVFIFDWLRHYVATAPPSERVWELEQLIFVEAPPTNWLESVVALIEEIYARESDEGSRTRWSVTMQRFVKLYSKPKGLEP